MSGYLVDRIFAPFVAAFFFLLPCLGIDLVGSTISPVVGIITLGLASGTEIDMIGFLTSRYFGMKRFGQLYGYLFACFVVGSAVGPYMMGLAFVRLHSYEPALWTFGAFMLLATAAIHSLGPYRYPPEESLRHAPGRLQMLLRPSAHKEEANVHSDHSTPVCGCSFACLRCLRSKRRAARRHG